MSEGATSDKKLKIIETKKSEEASPPIVAKKSEEPVIPKREERKKDIVNLRQGIQLDKDESLQKEPEKPVETLPKKELIDSKIWAKGQDVKHAIENTVDNYLENLIIDAVNEYNTLKDR